MVIKLHFHCVSEEIISLEISKKMMIVFNTNTSGYTKTTRNYRFLFYLTCLFSGKHEHQQSA